MKAKDLCKIGEKYFDLNKMDPKKKMEMVKNTDQKSSFAK